jgi:hypothetical protein
LDETGLLFSLFLTNFQVEVSSRIGILGANGTGYDFFSFYTNSNPIVNAAKVR